MPSDYLPTLGGGRPFEPPAIPEYIQWDEDEEDDFSQESQPTSSNRRNSRNSRTSTSENSQGEDPIFEEDEGPRGRGLCTREFDEEMRDLAAWLRQHEAEKEQETDPHLRYLHLIDKDETIKVFSSEHHGYKILYRERTAREMEKINKTNFDIMKFVYSRDRETIECGKSEMRDWSLLDGQIIEQIDDFLREHGAQSFRSGALSVASEPDLFSPTLYWRGTADNKVTLLRPVTVDGVAILAATKEFDYYPFSWKMKKSEEVIYDNKLNLNVKAVFDVIMEFLIRGHKTKVYLPKYYKKYVSPYSVALVDDVAAFEKLLKLGFIEFSEIREREHDSRWYNVVAKIADRDNSVFVSSYDHQAVCRSELNRPDRHTFSKPSDRILTACFYTGEGGIMVLEPSIRFKDEEENRDIFISSEEILRYGPTVGMYEYSEQLYLQDQIQLICELCQLYPLTGQNKVSVKQLLELVVRAESGFEMNGLSRQNYYDLWEKYCGGNNNSNDHDN